MIARSQAGLLVSVILCLGFAFAASAQNHNILVRSGQHSGFSRLVFELGRPLAWVVTKKTDGYQIQFQDPSLSFDFSTVFSRLSRTRISDLTSEPIRGATRVRLETPCRCHIEVFEISPGRLVVDIKDGETDESALLAPDAGAPVALLPEDKSEAPEQPQLTVLQPPDHRAERFTKIKPATLAEEEGKPSPTLKAPLNLVLPDPRVAEAQERLVAQLGRALSQGVVEPIGLDMVPKTEPTKAQPEQLPAKTPPTTIASADPEKQTTSTVADHINFNVQNVLDRDRAQTSNELEPAGTSKICTELPSFDIQKWSQDNGFNEAVAALRLPLVGELDRVDRGALLGLIKLYVFNGFGSEARALMTAFKGDLASAPLLAALSELLETGDVSDSSTMRSLAICDGPIVLWVTAAIGPGTAPDPARISKIISYFGTLPKPLRERIGPTLGTKFLDTGMVSEATKIADLIARSPGDHGHDYALFDARLDLEHAKTGEAYKTLWALIDTNQPNAADATVLLIKDYIRTGQAVPEPLVIEAASRALEMRFSAVGKSLRRLEIQAHAQAQQQAKGFEILVHETAIGVFSPEEQNEIFGDIFQSFDATKQAPERLLETYYQYSDFLTAEPSMDPARRQLAKAFLEIGLPDSAVDIMAIIKDRWTDHDRLLLGQAHLSMAEPTATLEVLQNLYSPEASDLRAKALLMQGSLDPALHSLSADSDRALRERIIWQSGRYDLVSEASLPTRQIAANYALAESGSKPAEDGGPLQTEAVSAFRSRLDSPTDLTLHSLQQLLAESRLSRGFLENFLNDHPDP